MRFRLFAFLALIGLLFAGTYPAIAQLAQGQGGGIAAGGGGAASASATPTPAFISGSSGSANSGTLTLTLPAGLTQGQIEYVILYGFQTTAATFFNLPYPTGWTVVQSRNNGNSANQAMVLKRTFQTGDPSTLSFSNASGGSVGCAAAFWNNTNEDIYGSFSAAGTIAPPSITTVTNNDLTLLFTAWGDTNLSFSAVATGFTDAVNLASNASHQGCDIEYKLNTSAGTVSSSGITLSGAQTQAIAFLDGTQP